MTHVAHLIRGVQKTEILFRFGYKKIRTKSEPSKNLTSVQMFSNKHCMQSAVQIKSDKNNFAFIECAEKESFKTRSNRV